MRTLGRICVTPVKGMALHHPDDVLLGPSGIAENRRFYFVDAFGELFSGSDDGRLVQVVPRYDPSAEHLALTFPDGTQVSGAADALSGTHRTNFYGRPVAAHEVDGEFGHAVSAFIGRDLTMLRCDDDGAGADMEPLTLVSYASVADLARHGRRDDALDSRRFRINLELEGCEPYDEDAWEGTRVQVGDAVLRVGGQVPRCVVTTQSPDTGVKDWNTLTQIAKYRPRIQGDGGLPFGVYARVELPARVRRGSSVVPLG
jgi:uncharacterized protein